MKASSRQQTGCEEDVEVVTMEQENDSLLGSRVPIAVIGTLTNVTVIIMLVVTASRRPCANGFTRNIFSLCVSDLITAVFVIPTSLVYHGDVSITHKSEICNAWAKLAYCNRALSCCILISMCIYCLVTKLRDTQKIKLKIYKYIEITLIVAPWIFILIVYVPLFLIEQSNSTSDNNFADQLCFFTDNNYHFPMTMMLLVVPPCLLIVTIIVMHVIYKVMQRRWECSQEPETESEESLRMSTIGTWFVSLMTICCWSPFIVMMILLTFCRSSSSSVVQCHPSLHVIDATYTVSLIPSAVTPLIWFCFKDSRLKFTQIITRIRQACAQRISCTCCTSCTVCQKTTAEDVNTLTEY